MVNCPVCKKNNCSSIDRTSIGKIIYECGYCGWQFNHVEMKKEKVSISQDSHDLLAKINTKKAKKTVTRKKARPTRPTPKQEEFVAIMFFSLVFACIPIISLPFDILGTFFHEASHGIAILLTGGEIREISVGTLGGGRIYHSPLPWYKDMFVGWSGYSGAVLWGVLLYRVGLRATPGQSFFFVIILILLMGVSTVLWVKEISTVFSLLIIYLVMSLSLILLTKHRWQKRLNVFIKFVGIYLIVQAIAAPFFLFHDNNLGDAGGLARLSNLPDTFWIIQWALIGFFGLWWAWGMTKKIKPAQVHVPVPVRKKTSRRRVASAPSMA